MEHTVNFFYLTPWQKKDEDEEEEEDCIGSDILWGKIVGNEKTSNSMFYYS